jgi:hypothetical protein
MAKGKEQTMIHNAPHRNLKIGERQTSQWPKGKEQTMIHSTPHRNLKIEERQTSQWPKEKNRQRFTVLNT